MNGTQEKKTARAIAPVRVDDAPQLEASAELNGQDSGWDRRVRAHRRRQASVAAILEQTFGRFADSDPSLWDRRAYLMLVGIVYERLASDEAELPTDELIALAKLLAESRRADNQSRASQNTGTEASASQKAIPFDNELPSTFGNVVRQIYGTNVDPNEAVDTNVTSTCNSGRPRVD